MDTDCKMENISTFSSFKSHPGVPLEQHLIRVKEIAVKNFEQEAPFLHFEKISTDTFQNILTIACLSHDLGKATSFFQHWLLEKEKSEFSNHALISAIQGFYLAKTLLEKTSLQDKDILLHSLCIFQSIRRHHGNFGNFDHDTQLSEVNYQALTIQTKNIDSTNYTKLLYNLLPEGFPRVYSTDQITEWINNFCDLSKTIIPLAIRNLYSNKSFYYYYLENLLFSLLIDADKTEVTVGRVPDRWSKQIPFTIIDKYKENQKFESTQLNKLRETAYKEILNNPLEEKTNLYSINLPTGLGKTLDVLSFSLKLRQMVSLQTKISPRIIYSLPFLSIIDQNADIFTEILSINGNEPPTSVLLKHHHLADVIYEPEYQNEEEINSNEFEKKKKISLSNAKMLIEGWNSEIIVTTFIQVFNALFGYRNRSLKKLHRMVGSILILDEIQSIPVIYWNLLKEALEYLSDHWSIKVVFVTATKPEIFTDSEMTQLLKPENYFSKLNRITLFSHIEKEIFIDTFMESITIAEDKSYLFILNTIQATKTVYEQISKILPEENITYITTHVVPFERLQRIKNIKTKKSRIAITTQLVEAGVDIDFDIVYRDLAPLDSINQASGRCNRNAGAKGSVHVVKLINEKHRPFCNSIYDKILLEQTEHILQKYPKIEENQFRDLLIKYYKRIRRRISEDKSVEISNAIKKMVYQSDSETAVDDFKLIKTYEKLNVFVSIDKEAEAVWTQYERIFKIQDKFARKVAFDGIKGRFAKYQISIPLTVENIPPEYYGIRFVSFDQIDEFYDTITGFKTVNKDALVW